MRERRFSLEPFCEFVAAHNGGFRGGLSKQPRHRPDTNEQTGYDCHLCARGARAPARRHLSSGRIEVARLTNGSATRTRAASPFLEAHASLPHLQESDVPRRS